MRVREQLVEDDSEDPDERHEVLTKRLAAKLTEKSHYVKLYAQGFVDDYGLEVHLTDLRNRVENLKMLIASVESDLDRQYKNSGCWLSDRASRKWSGITRRRSRRAAK